MYFLIKLIIQNIISGQIFAVIRIEVEMAISNAILNQTKKLKFKEIYILLIIILKN